MPVGMTTISSINLYATSYPNVSTPFFLSLIFSYESKFYCNDHSFTDIILPNPT